MVVSDKDAEKLIMEITEKCATGRVGDGKIFVKNVDDLVIRNIIKNSGWH